jgi:hypothetical protein
MISAGRQKFVTIAVLTPVRNSFDLSPNLSPTRREALSTNPYFLFAISQTTARLTARISCSREKGLVK